MRRLAILFLGGFNLLLLQFFVIREVNAILRSTEIIILLTTLAYFSGYSTGYWLSDRLSNRAVMGLAWGMWGLHLTLPFSIRYLTGFAGQWTESVTFLTALFFTAFGLATFYSLLLPYFIEQTSPERLGAYYGVELVGAAAGAVVLMWAGQSPRLIPLFYQINLVGIIFLLTRQTLVLPLGISMAIGYALIFPRLQTQSMNYVYNSVHAFDNGQVVYSANSPYQKIDIVRGQSGRHYLYLDGGLNYGSDELARFNIFLSELPAHLQLPTNILIVGSGSMQSVARVSPLTQRVTTVELDPAVVAGGRVYYAGINRLAEIENWRLVIDDAKHFLGSSGERYDLVIMDIPAPLTIQEGLLHSVEFYRLVKSRLKPGGIIAVSLSGRFKPAAQTPRAVTASLLAVFDEIYVVTPASAGRSFAFAGDDIWFSRQVLAGAMHIRNEHTFEIFERAEIVDIVAGMEPISLSNLRFIIWRSWLRLLRDHF